MAVGEADEGAGVGVLVEAGDGGWICGDEVEGGVMEILCDCGVPVATTDGQSVTVTATWVEMEVNCGVWKATSCPNCNPSREEFPRVRVLMNSEPGEFQPANIQWDNVYHVKGPQ